MVSSSWVNLTLSVKDVLCFSKYELPINHQTMLDILLLLPVLHCHQHPTSMLNERNFFPKNEKSYLTYFLVFSLLYCKFHTRTAHQGVVYSRWSVDLWKILVLIDESAGSKVFPSVLLTDGHFLSTNFTAVHLVVKTTDSSLTSSSDISSVTILIC